MTKIIERVAEHYDTHEVEFGTTYIWCPESVVLECTKCAKKMTLTRSELIDTQPECECGKGHSASAREEVVLELVDEDTRPTTIRGATGTPPRILAYPFN